MDEEAELYMNQSAPSALEAVVPHEVEPSTLQRLGRIARRSAVGVVLAVEISPLNEVARVAAFAGAQSMGLDPFLVGAVYGGATLAIEGVAALAAADALDWESSKTTVERINNRLEKIGIPKDAKTNSVTKAGIAFLGGSAISTAVKHREEPERTRSENLRYGLRSAVGLAGVMTVEGYLLSNGIENPGVTTIGGAIIAIGGIFAAARWAKRRVQSDKIPNNIESPVN